MGKYTVGIDLGTTNTVCCTFNNTYEFIKNKRGFILPSVLMYKDGKIIVGDSAKQRALRNPNNVISSSKTYMGDPEKRWAIDDMVFTPTDVAAEILTEIRQAAQRHFCTDEQIEAVITVPAYFADTQYDETKKAAEKAGLKVIRILSEPVAAALAYGLDDEVNNIFVVDIGGGTFDVCLLEIDHSSKGEKRFSTKAVDGDPKLGGDDFDDVIEQMCYSQLRMEFGIDLSSHKSSGLDAESYGQAKQKIRQKSEQAKIALSDVEETNIEIANLCKKNDEPINLKLHITKTEFENKAMPLFNKIKRTINRCIENNNIEPTSIEKVVFVGGSANIPYMKTIVSDCLGLDAYADRDLSKLVAMGAALCAAQNDSLVSTKLIIEDILSHSLGIEIYQEDGDKIYRYAPMLVKNTIYPAKREETFCTVNDNQKSVVINVYEGESIENLDENIFYGGFELDNIKDGPAGIPIKVDFEINENRQLIVTAWDQSTESKKSITINKTDKPKKIEKKIEKPKKPVKISVTSSGCDDIGSILDSMNIKYFDFDENKYDCDILFINCLTDDYIDSSSLRCFVESGGCLYASCYADEYMKRAFPGVFSTDHSGTPHEEKVTVEDDELREVIGNSIDVKFDTQWAKLYSAKDSTCILRSTIGEKYPIMVSLRYGKGMIFFTCFHNHVQASEKEKALLKLLVIRQIGMNGNMSMSETSQALGIDIDKIKAQLKR